MLENVIGKGARRRVASLFARRGEEMHVSEVARALGIAKSRASVCLRDLESEGILESRKVGRSVIYRPSKTEGARLAMELLNPEEKLLQMLGKDVVRDLRHMKAVSVALFGSALKEIKEGSDVDIIAIFDRPDEDEVNMVSSKLTEKYGIDVSIMPMKTEEFREKAKRGEEFVINVIAIHKLLYGRPLEEVVWQEK